MKYTAQQYNDVNRKLPQEVRDVVNSADTVDHLYLIGQKHNLHIDMIGKMVNLTLDVMMGMSAGKTFVKDLQEILEIPALDASVLARDIDENVFKPIKTTMIKIYADGAPYKPSSSLVQFYEEDDEHKELDKDTLLREIENPTAVKPKVEIVVTTSTALETMEEVKEQKEMEVKFTPTAVVTAPPSREGPHPDLPSRGEPAVAGRGVNPETPAISMLEKLASMKLNQTFVMPKGEPDLNPKPFVSAAAKPDATPYIEPAPKTYAADPYREPLN
ncbi:MAG: hypothetical protein V4438_03515 [Patescibacteria group bacterium]